MASPLSQDLRALALAISGNRCRPELFQPPVQLRLKRCADSLLCRPAVHVENLVAADCGKKLARILAIRTPIPNGVGRGERATPD